MITPNGFASWREYFSFTLAREYEVRATGQLFQPRQEYLERAGKIFSVAVLSPLDALLQGIRNPAVIAALTLVSLFFVSIAFYPFQTWALVTSVLPALQWIQGAHVHAVFYLISQSLILGVGLRTIGRLSNEQLMGAYQRREIVPVPIGAIVYRQ